MRISSFLRRFATAGLAFGISCLCFGQKPPGTTPEVFAPGVVSRDGIQMKLTMSADGTEILYTERDPATNAVSFIMRHREGDSWSEPVVLPYAREYMDLEPSLSPHGKKILFVSNRPAGESRGIFRISGWPRIRGMPGGAPSTWVLPSSPMIRPTSKPIQRSARTAGYIS